MLDGISDALGSHYSPAPFTGVHRFHFQSRTRHCGVSVSDFVVALRSLSLDCGYDIQLDNVIRDRIVFGGNTATLLTRIL